MNCINPKAECKDCGVSLRELEKRVGAYVVIEDDGKVELSSWVWYCKDCIEVNIGRIVKQLQGDRTGGPIL